jgi:2-polyprenyl-3-methyl-5-hydroxy-6-metoxy-1,4-benzoquinol methylase
MGTEYWKEAAEDYSKGVIAEYMTLRPVILELIKNVRDKQVLDLGCGDGRYSIVMAEAGAKVIGIDASEHQIRLAKSKNKHKSIEYSIRDGSDLSEIKSRSIDLVLMNMLIPDLRDKSSLGKVLAEVNRVLKPDGKVIASNLHPLYLSSDQDSADKATGFKKEDYYKEGHTYEAKADIRGGGRFTFHETHFSLTYLSKELEKNGFLIKGIIESKSVPEKGMHLPKYIVFECIKSKN